MADKITTSAPVGVEGLAERAAQLYEAATSAGATHEQALHEAIEHALAQQPAGVGLLSPDDVQWVVNDLAELGVRIGDQCFFLYKGSSLVYEDARHENGQPMHIRTVGKREFGECCHPINREDLARIGTVSLDDSDRWEVMPAAQQPAAPDRDDLSARSERLRSAAQFALDYLNGHECINNKEQREVLTAALAQQPGEVDRG